jgi:hypothetical protein
MAYLSFPKIISGRNGGVGPDKIGMDLKPQQLATAVAQNQKREQSLKGQGRNHTQINGGDRLRMVAKKCIPALRRRRPTRYHVFGDSRLRGAFYRPQSSSKSRPTAGASGFRHLRQ